MTGSFAIPNRPNPSDQRDITQIEADYDYITSKMDAIVATKQSLFQWKGLVISTVGSGDFLLRSASVPYASGSSIGVDFPDFWYGDVSGDLDFPTPKTTTGRLRVFWMTNSTAPGENITVGLYTAGVSAGGANAVTLTFGAAVVGTTVDIVAPGAGSKGVVQTGDFTLPTSNNGLSCGVHLAGSMAAGAAIALSVQMLKGAV